MNHGLYCDNSSTIGNQMKERCCTVKKYYDRTFRLLKMESSGKLLSARLLSLLKNGQWDKDDVVKLFKALVEQFNGRNEDFHTWMMKILHQVEIHKVSVSDLTLNGEIVDDVEDKINKISKNTEEKTLDEILKEIEEQAVIDEQTMAEVKDIVSSVSKCLSASSAPHLQGIKQSLFQLCKAVEKTMNFTPRLTQMVSWCILVLSESSRLVQVGTGEGKSCIVAMFAACQVRMGKTPDIISSSPVLAERDCREWLHFYKELNITADVNTNKSKDKELKECYECQVVYGTGQIFASDFLQQCSHRREVRPKREFRCVIVDEVDSLMLDKGREVVYLNTDVPLMESFNEILAEIWLIINQVKYLNSGEILGPIQSFSQVLSETIHDNKDCYQLVVQAAVDAGIMPIKQMQENMLNVLKQLDNASMVQIVGFITMFVQYFPEYLFKLYQESSDGTLRKLNEISVARTIKRQEISVLLLGYRQYRVVHLHEDALVMSLGKRIKMSYQTETIKDLNKSPIPDREDLITGKVQIWIENALQATKMTLGHEYILHEDGVVPVDYRCTGVVQNNMRWGEGLQQFLQMKHQTRLSNMSLITNFMSNVGLFKKYNDQIYGITGTLGDQTELDMLKNLYSGMKTCKIPSFRRRKLYELEGLLIPEDDEWIRTICDAVKHQVFPTVYRGPRAALIICETINRAEMFHKTLADTMSKDKLKLYVNNNMNNSTVIDKTVEGGDVIIATNLAGRGTDLKVCKSVNEAGGLFVLQTYLPLNIRVEQQVFGRTARQGSPGSAQLIMCASHFLESVKLVMDAIGSLDDNLLSHLNSLKSTPMPCGDTESLSEKMLIHYLDNQSFQTPEVMILALTGFLNMNPNPVQKSNLEAVKDARNILVNVRLSRFLEKDVLKVSKEEELFSIYLDIFNSVYEDDVFPDQRDVIVSSLHECWGLWLLMNFSEEKPTEMLKEKLKVDLSSAKQKLFSKQSPSSMVYYYIRSGNSLREKGHLAESIEMYTKALEENAAGSIIPLYNRALTTIMKKDAGYITWALADLEKAVKAINSYKLQLSHIHTHVKSSSHKPSTEADTFLTKQIQMKCMIMDQLKLNIQEAIMKLKRAESRGGNVTLLEKHVIFLVEDFLKRTIGRRDMDLADTFALFVKEHFIKRTEIRRGDVNLTEKYVMICTENSMRRSESRREDVNFAESLSFVLLDDSVCNSERNIVELLREYEYIMSLGLDTIFNLDTRFSVSGFVSNKLNLV
ncbi:protein translocase subunit SecA-like [Danio aesculapii]|uniref:protein translocase subunit SecA-like n=1 Tax=Danio aesculapii TaxID=1142201 RepID=UPI0024C0C855|nr:protein translocase subunit SecA-like [Danio aesculapii]